MTMESGYTEKEIRQMVVDALDADLHFFYQQPFLNYQGKAIDSRQPYVEVIADELLQCNDQIKRMGVDVPVRRTKNFNLMHDGAPNVDARIKRFGKLNYSEKLLAIAIHNSDDEYCFGKIFDYQIPLKERQKDRFGEIDLAARSGASIKLLELKIDGKGKETLLRALLEVYTYYKLLAGSAKKFITDFDLSADAYFQPGVLTEGSALSGQTLSNMDAYPSMSALISQLNADMGVSIEFFLFDYPSHGFERDAIGRVLFSGDFSITQVLS
jgi:hypothetical protein